MANHDIVFGFHAIESQLEQNPKQVNKIYFAEGQSGSRGKKLLARAKKLGISVSKQPKSSLDQQAGTSKHQGVIAFVAALQQQWDESDLLSEIENATQPVVLLVLDGVQDPHNLGACLRTAAAANVLAVVAPKDKSVGLTPVARKVASGGAERCPFVQVTNLSRFLTAIKSLGVWCFGAAGDGVETIYQQDLTGSLAWVMGAEGSGLRLGTQKQCDHVVSIPLDSGMESLNVSVATGICLFETVRQRREW